MMSVVKIIELVGSSGKSLDDAVQQALAEARKTLRNIKAVDVVSVGLRGDNLQEWRAPTAATARARRRSAGSERPATCSAADGRSASTAPAASGPVSVSANRRPGRRKMR